MQNSKPQLKVQNYFLFFKVKRLEPSILDISSISVNNLFILFLSASVASLNNPSQYFVSLADFKDISKNFMKSLLELEDLASTILAPTEVADLNN